MKHIIVVILVAVLTINTTSAWLSGYDYRMQIDINNTGNDLTYWQYNFTNSTASLVSAGKMDADGGDCRITNATDVLQPFWNETEFNSSNTKIWVNATSLGNVTNTTHYMYYGNSSVSLDTDGDATFEFFDDFYSGEPLIDWTLDTGSDYAHFGIIKDGFHYSTIYYPPTGRIAKVNITTGEEVDNLSVSVYCVTAPIIDNGWLYITISGGSLYKCNTSNLSDYTSTSIGFNDLSETMTYDATYLYLPETTKISKRNLSDLAEVDSFACTGSRGVLRLGDVLYHITGNGVFHAVHKSNMTELWNIQLNMTDFKSYCVPIYDETHDRIYVADSNTARTNGYVYAINPNSHDVDWYVNVGQVTTTPTYYNNKLFLSIYGGTDDLMALDVTNNGNEIWSKEYTADDGWGGWIADDNYLYQVTHGNAPVYFRIVNQSDGEILHEESLTGNGKPCTLALLTDGRAIASSMDPALRCFEVGAGNAVDVEYYHGNQYYTGHIPNAITSYNMFSTGYVLTDKWTSIAGTWAASGGLLHQTATGGSWKELRMKDYTNSGDFAIKMSFKAIDDSEILFSLHHQDFDNYVQSHAKTPADKLRVIREIGGVYQLWESGAVTINTGTWYDFETKILGLNYALELDSFSWNQTIDSDPGFDKVEIGVYAGRADFDDVFIRKYVANEPVASLGAEESAPSYNDITLGANKYGLLRKNVSAAETFSTIAAGFTHDVCFTWFNSTSDSWESYWVGDSYNSAQSIPEHESYFVLMDGIGETVSCSVASAGTVAIPVGWSTTYLRESTSNTLTAIKSDMGGSATDLYAWNHTASGTGAWTNAGAYSVLPNQGLLVNASSGFNWDGAVP